MRDPDGKPIQMTKQGQQTDQPMLYARQQQDYPINDQLCVTLIQFLD
jgi:hypothetical protein